MKKVLTFAGSDTSGGAGIQADIKTFQELGVYGMTALTTIVAQDPKNDWFHAVFPIEIETVKAQLSTILEGVGVDAMKTGMLPSVETIELAAQIIDQYQLTAVIDPVMVCKGADEALHPENVEALRNILVPKATVTTPNLFEAAQLAEMPPIETVEDMKEAAKKIQESGAKYVIVKGGSKLNHPTAVDVLYDGQEFTIFEEDLLNTTYTHGAGCTFSSAILAEIVKGSPVKEAIKTAKAFITKAIKDAGPLNQYVGSVKQYANRS